jgi:amino acid transporter
MPYKLSAVNEKTHSPIIAIVIISVLTLGATIWTALSATFFTVWGIAILFAYLPILFVGIAAIALPFRRKEFYAASLLGKSNAGKTWLIIGGVWAILEVALIMFLGFRFSSQLGWTSWWMILLAVAGLFVFGYGFYYIAKAVRKGQGRDLSLVYKQIPPE